MRLVLGALWHFSGWYWKTRATVRRRVAASRAIGRLERGEIDD